MSKSTNMLLENVQYLNSTFYKITSKNMFYTLCITESETNFAKISYKMQDHSQGGQKLIDYRHTRYGNEVYRGCFLEKDTIKRKLGVTIPLTVHVRRLMTQDYCIYRCR